MRILGLIPARGGSKGIPRKNIRLLCGKPLLQYTVEAALKAKQLTRIILSTDNAEIAEIGRRLGIDVPFTRPPELARDDTPMLPVIQHAVRHVESLCEEYDAICLLQPTNPLREPEDIDGCIELLKSSIATSVFTMLPVPTEYNPHWVYFRDSQDFLHLSTGETLPISRRQALPPAFHREGSVYVVRRNVLMNENTLYGSRVAGYLMSPQRSVNIDTPEDWHEAERQLCSKKSAI